MFDIKLFIVCCVLQLLKPSVTGINYQPQVEPIILSHNSVPQYAFSMSEASQFSFTVWNISKMKFMDMNPNPGAEYGISISVEKMICGNENGQTSVLIKGESTFRKIFCSNVDNRLNNFQNVKDFIDEETSFNVSSYGNWTGTSIFLVASLYVDVSGGCENCPDNFFCCGQKERACESKRYAFRPYGPQQIYKSRCIPMQSGSNGGSLVCNQHPNCGFYCNPDEAKWTCDERNPCSSGYFCKASAKSGNYDYVWPVILAVSFFTVSPTIIGVVICYHRRYMAAHVSLLRLQQSRQRSRRERHVSNSFHVNPVFVVSPQSNTLQDGVGGIDESNLTITDLPPSYDEVHEIGNQINKEQELPPPSYADSVLDLRNIGIGVENPAFDGRCDAPSTSSDFTGQIV